MEFKVIILSLACFSLLTSPVLSAVIYTQNSPCLINESLCGVQPSLLGAGLAAKGAAALMAVKGIAALALKAAAIKGALIAKGVAAVVNMGAALLNPQPVVYPVPVGVPVMQCNPCPNVVVGQPQAEIMSEIYAAAQARESMFINEPLMYDYLTAPRYYSVPIIDEYEV